ncbi:MAG: BrnA antitoxin family protein [Alkalispirochaeta sp.]
MSDRSKYDDFELEPEYDFSNGIRGRFFHPKKKSTTIRLDEDLILFFKKKASEKKVGYQSLVNAALREYVHDHSVE